MKVRIHLNLANPELAESVIKIQSKNNTWVTVAYANKIKLINVVPYVDVDKQIKINEGLSKKTPHAFLEGELISFEGRFRDKSPLILQEKIIHLNSNIENKITKEHTLINYNRETRMFR